MGRQPELASETTRNQLDNMVGCAILDFAKQTELTTSCRSRLAMSRQQREIVQPHNEPSGTVDLVPEILK
jgi:hypothetical protein